MVEARGTAPRSYTTIEFVSTVTWVFKQDRLFLSTTYLEYTGQMCRRLNPHIGKRLRLVNPTKGSQTFRRRNTHTRLPLDNGELFQKLL